jgi:hypothetical protein
MTTARRFWSVFAGVLGSFLAVCSVLIAIGRLVERLQRVEEQVQPRIISEMAAKAVTEHVEQLNVRDTAVVADAKTAVLEARRELSTLRREVEAEILAKLNDPKLVLNVRLHEIEEDFAVVRKHLAEDRGDVRQTEVDLRLKHLETFVEELRLVAGKVPSQSPTTPQMALQTPSAPANLPEVERQLLAANIILAEDQPETVRATLGGDTGYGPLARNCAIAMRGFRLRGPKAIPLLVINKYYKIQISRKPTENLQAGEYDRIERYKPAIAEAYRDVTQAPKLRPFGEIAERVSGGGEAR